MKMKMLLALLASALLLGVMGGTAFAFHAGGVAHCDGCHSMHNSADNPRAGSAFAADLMKGSDPSSTCLNCHNGSGRYHIKSADGSNTNQGGDFFWVTSAASYDYFPGHGSVQTANSANFGHNVIAQDFGMSVDPDNATSPGGGFSSSNLQCTSCHDPHGQVNGGTANGAQPISMSGSYAGTAPAGTIKGNYRLLGSAGYGAITAAAPVAQSNSYDGKYVDYGTGMTDWCLSCHAAFNATNMHPLKETVPLRYNQYVKTGDFTGTVATAFDALVPFERGADATLKYNSTVGVQDANDVVMCLSCHRAHASAFNNAVRWDTSTEFLAESGVFQSIEGWTNGTITIAQSLPNAIPYYGGGQSYNTVAKFEARYGAYQRSLCNKCHVKD